jgi:hypothetical protein
MLSEDLRWLHHPWGESGMSVAEQPFQLSVDDRAGGTVVVRLVGELDVAATPRQGVVERLARRRSRARRFERPGIPRLRWAV